MALYEATCCCKCFKCYLNEICDVLAFFVNERERLGRSMAGVHLINVVGLIKE